MGSVETSADCFDIFAGGDEAEASPTLSSIRRFKIDLDSELLIGKFLTVTTIVESLLPPGSVGSIGFLTSSLAALLADAATILLVVALGVATTTLLVAALAGATTILLVVVLGVATTTLLVAALSDATTTLLIAALAGVTTTLLVSCVFCEVTSSSFSLASSSEERSFMLSLSSLDVCDVIRGSS